MVAFNKFQSSGEIESSHEFEVMEMKKGKKAFIGNVCVREKHVAFFQYNN